MSRGRNNTIHEWAFYFLNSISSLPRSLNLDNARKFFLTCRTYGFRAAIKAAVRNLGKSNAILTHTLIPLSLPDVSIVDSEENLPAVDKKVSVVIPTRNAGRDLHHLIKKLKRQKGIKEIEIIVVDSGSTDETLEIAENEKTKIIGIPPEDFDHAYSRNKGAENAGGDYILFVAQDALPLTDRWLWKLATALEQNDLAAVSCAEYPRSDCDLFYQWTTRHHYKTLGLDRDRILQFDQSCGIYLGLRANSQIHTVTALVKKDIFSKYGFRKKYAEDLDLGMRLIMDGHKTGFLYSTRVLHSHNRPAYYFLKRSYVDSKYLKDVFANYSVPKIDDPLRLFRDIINLYAKTEQAASYVADLKNDESTEMTALTASVRQIYSTDNDGSEIAEKEDAEAELKTFIHSLAPLSGMDSATVNGSENLLLSRFISSLDLFLADVSRNHKHLDPHLLQEFRAGLFKIAATVIGSHIAFLYLTLSEYKTLDRFPEGLDSALCSGI